MVNIEECRALKNDIMSLLRIRHNITNVQLENESIDSPIIVTEELPNDNSIEYHIDVDIPYEMINYENLNVEDKIQNPDALIQISKSIIDKLEILTLKYFMCDDTGEALSSDELRLHIESGIDIDIKVLSSGDNQYYDTINFGFFNIDNNKYDVVDDNFAISFTTTRHFRYIYSCSKRNEKYLTVDGFMNRFKGMII